MRQGFKPLADDAIIVQDLYFPGLKSPIPMPQHISWIADYKLEKTYYVTYLSTDRQKSK